MQSREHTFKCWNCEQSGHKALHCWKTKRQCYKCSKYGHIERYCPATVPYSSGAHSNPYWGYGNCDVRGRPPHQGACQYYDFKEDGRVQRLPTYCSRAKQNPSQCQPSGGQQPRQRSSSDIQAYGGARSKHADSQFNHPTVKGHGNLEGQINEHWRCDSVSIPSEIISWEERTKAWYPYLDVRTYFLPPVYMNRTHHKKGTVGKQNVLVTRSPLQDSDIREDQTHNNVLRCIEKLSEKEVMFVISQLQFGNYPNKPSYTAAVSLLLPVDHPALMIDEKKVEGDFDILIIHRSYGVIAGEIKSVGDNFCQLPKTEEEKDHILVEKIEQAISQLEKCVQVLTALIPVYETGKPRVTTTLMLPNISDEQMHRVLDSREHLRESLCHVLGAPKGTDPVRLCLVSSDILSPERWWRQRVTDAGTDPAMTNPVYLNLVARFAGPTTTVRVFCSSKPALAHNSDIRTPGEGVEETASRFTPVDIVLHPEQVSILSRQDKLVFVHGPPGTGKSVILLMKARECARKNQDVHIVSTHYGSLAASHMIFHQTEEMECSAARRRKHSRQQNPARTHLHPYDFRRFPGDVDKAVEELSALVHKKTRQLHVIVDEVFNMNMEEPFTVFCTKLHDKIPNLHLWAASLYADDRPLLLTEVILTEPLRTPPSVTEVIQESDDLKEGGSVHGYTTPPHPVPCHGPPVKHVYHTGKEHCLEESWDCEKCGQDVAEILRGLEVGKQNPERTAQNCPKALHFRDVFILTYWHNLHKTTMDRCGNERLSNGSFLRGLEGAGIPCRVLATEEGVSKVATMSCDDEVVVAHSPDIQGLERKIVVFVQGKSTADDDGARLHAFSRCTSQLVLVTPPPEHRH